MRQFSAVITFALSLAALTFLPGCPDLDPSAKETKAKLAAIDAQHKLDAANAKAKPASHPVTSANESVTRLREPLYPIFVFSLLAVGVCVGLQFTSFCWLSKIGIPVSLAVCALSLVGIIALPFFPWILLGCAAAIIGLLIYELVRTKSLRGAITAVESDLGVTSSTPTPTSTPAPTVTQTTSPAKVIASTEAIVEELAHHHV